MNNAIKSVSSLLLALTLFSQNAVADDWLHTVRPGDTFWGICKELTQEPNCWLKLQTVNAEVDDALRLSPGSLIKIPVNWLKTPPSPASVEFVRGKAYVERRGSRSTRVRPGSTTAVHLSTAPNTKPLVAGDMLNMGDKVITLEGNVLIRFADNSSFLLRSQSEILLERLSAHGETGMVDTNLRLNHGSGKAKVNTEGGKSRYKISTPSAIAAARGTEFSISADADNKTTRSEVLAGRVAVSAFSQEKNVDRGFGTMAEAGKPPIEPKKLLRAPALKLAELTETPFSLKWQAIEGATGYIIDVYAGMNDDALLSSTTISDNSLLFDNLPDNTYNFTVRAIDDIGLKGLVASAYTTTTTALRAPILNKNNVSISKTAVKITWAAVPAVDQYIVELSDNQDFSSIVDTATTTDTDTEFSIVQGTTYYLRAKSLYPKNQVSAFGSAHAFTSETRDTWMLILQSLGILAVLI